MTKEIIIIALIILVIWLVYQKKKQENKTTQTDDNQRDHVAKGQSGQELADFFKNILTQSNTKPSDEMVQKKLDKLRKQYSKEKSDSQEEPKSDDPRVNFMRNLEKKDQKKK